MAELDGAIPEGRYRAIVEAQVELISLARPDGTLVYVNPSYARQVGTTPQALIGRSLYEQVPEADREAVRRLVERVITTGQSVASENRLLTAGGTTRLISWTNGVQVEDGEPLLHSVGRDVTERRRLEQEVRESAAFVRKVTDNLPVRIAYVDRERRYRFVNLAHCQRFDVARVQVLGRTRDELLGHATPTPIDAHIQAVMAGQPQHFEYDEPFSGELRRFEVRLMPDVQEDGQVHGYFYIGMDITERSRAERLMRTMTLDAQRQSDILRLVADAIPATVVVVSAELRYRFVNRAFEQLVGLPREQIIGRSPADIIGAAEAERRKPWIARALAGEAVTFELDHEGPDGTRWTRLNSIPLRLSGGEVDGFVGISQDITAQRREQERLTELSQRDPLTGLLNRNGFELAIERNIRSGQGAALALLYIDLDRFKPVNDQHGHLVGDRLLEQVAQRLSQLVRPVDAVARLGGDEFAIVLVDLARLAHAEAVAAKVVAALAQAFEVDGLTLTIGASVGVAHGAQAQGGAEDLIRRADAQLYRAKAEGRGRHAS
ncbi:bifunctional diguanylate cyclase/phosphodiesterase [Sphaerotilus mobilis]|uniref:PAS domain S-box-containing protein/diguanylate cyclase (GGDEF)-like protein n=1 Tax=Sphaerotilus mobilis TaxID=47994 RepID=A0A4Q7LTY8_9BURK|nr:PAS domain-containing protein [Sphaerotilus mobilis]RZS58575.1 PAS domain S-box-containing protein/diguanylate cyclase (GGDEF)-like protein [Sphaerotilus mobilis]